MAYHFDERAFSVVEALVASLLVSLVAALAIPNIQQYRSLAFDASAHLDYTNLRNALETLKNDEQQTSNFIALNHEGQKSLPSPLAHLSLSPGTRLDYAYNLDLFGWVTLSALQVHHPSGSKTYRFVEVNGKRLEQVFR